MTTPEQLLERLKAVERDATGPPADTADRVWVAIEDRLAGGPAPPELDDAALLDQVPELAGSAGTASSVALKVVGAVVIVGGIGGALALLVDRDRPPDSAPAAIDDSPAQLDSAADEPGELTPVPLDVGPIEAPEPESLESESLESESPQAESRQAESPEIPTIRKKSNTADSPPKSLADEVALMQAISTALKQQDSHKVLKLVAEHERDFAKGQFIEERHAAKARALCQSGKHSAGKKQAASFAVRWPDSIHLASVEQDCGLDEQAEKVTH